jgi:hypothetical protein
MVPDPRDEQIVALTKERDFYATKADYLQKTAIIQQIFRGISNALWMDPLLGFQVNINYTINGNVWRSFLRTMRYLGGNIDLADADGMPGDIIKHFIGDAAVPPEWVYTITDVPIEVVPNENAVFADFIGTNIINNVGVLASGNILMGFRSIREFMVWNFPAIASAFSRMGEGNFFLVTADTGMDGLFIENSSVNGDIANITLDFGNNIANIFGITLPFNPIYLDDLRELGLMGGTQEQLEAFMVDISKIYK